jgi:hypothetical protein
MLYSQELTRSWYVSLPLFFWCFIPVRSFPTTFLFKFLFVHKDSDSGADSARHRQALDEKGDTNHFVIDLPGKPTLFVKYRCSDVLAEASAQSFFLRSRLPEGQIGSWHSQK